MSFQGKARAHRWFLPECLQEGTDVLLLLYGPRAVVEPKKKVTEVNETERVEGAKRDVCAQRSSALDL